MDQQDTSTVKRLEIIESHRDDDTCQTFVFHDEDHTLGNALAYMVLKNPDVQFAGYSVPHPSENRINLRIQTNGAQATDVLQKGLTDLNKCCEHVLKTFETRAKEYKRSQKRNIPQDIEMQLDT
ncbi:hypothetical protein ScPMuIL_011305 [Solemya velum]